MLVVLGRRVLEKRDLYITRGLAHGKYQREDAMYNY